MLPQTLGEAWKLGWRVRVRCLFIGPPHMWGHRDGVRCDTTEELDIKHSCGPAGLGWRSIFSQNDCGSRFVATEKFRSSSTSQISRGVKKAAR